MIDNLQQAYSVAQSDGSINGVYLAIGLTLGLWLVGQFNTKKESNV